MNKKINLGDLVEFKIFDKDTKKLICSYMGIIVDDLTKYSSWIADQRAGYFKVKWFTREGNLLSNANPMTNRLIMPPDIEKAGENFHSESLRIGRMMEYSPNDFSVNEIWYAQTIVAARLLDLYQPTMEILFSNSD